MRTACRLIEIVLKDGNESGDCDKFPYRVNLRNAASYGIDAQRLTVAQRVQTEGLWANDRYFG